MPAAPATQATARPIWVQPGPAQRVAPASSTTPASEP